jgi:hypothetical protein
MDSPILFIASHTAPRMTDADFARLRTFVQHGGMLFTQADWGGEAFSQWVAETLAKEIAPDYELKDLATDHELYTLHYQIKLPRPRLRAVSNGVRLLLVHSPTDLTMAWQQRAEKTKRPHYELGVNLFVYAAGKADLRNRLNSPVVPIPPNPPSATYKLARLRHDGNWNPEPFAWIRFARYLQWETGMTLSIHPTHIQNLDPKIYQMAHLTGTEALSLTNEQTLALKQYVEAGGTLVLDAAGGAGAFAESAEQFLSRVFPNEKGEALPPNHPLLTESADGFEAVPQQGILRPYAAAKLGGGSRVKLYTPGKGLILYSPIDLAGALVGTDTYLIHGHSPAYVHPLMKNLTLYTLDRQQ